jgi:LacI family transcriptional regulator
MRLRDHGEDVNVIFMDEAGNEVDTAIQVCTEQKPKGIVFLGANLNGFREKFSAISIPCVLVTDNAQELGFENLSSFSTDDTRAAAEAVDYLIRMGHQRIGILGGHLVSHDGRVGTGRVYGAIEELKKKGITFHPETDFVPCRFSMEEGYDGCGTLMKRGKDTKLIKPSLMP